MKALNLRLVDEEDARHQVAWLSVAAGAQKRNGDPVYKKYQLFYDKEEALERASKPQKKAGKFSALSKHLKEKSNGNK